MLKFHLRIFQRHWITCNKRQLLGQVVLVEIASRPGSTKGVRNNWVRQMRNKLGIRETGTGKFNACCPFCVESGKKPDTKYHLSILPGKWYYCYRCGVKGPYARLIELYEIDIPTQIIVNTPITVKDDAFNDFLLANTVSLCEPSIYSNMALHYLTKRGLTAELMLDMNIYVGVKSLFGRVVFVDLENKYYMGRSFLSFIQPKTFNPVGGNKPLMYYHKVDGGMVYLCEGVFDMVPFLKTGKEVFALLGKDISPYQIKQLSECGCGNVVIALDADAGQSAIALAAKLASAIPFINIGIMWYDNMHDKRKDPGEYDTQLFTNINIMWTREVNPSPHNIGI